MLRFLKYLFGSSDEKPTDKVKITEKVTTKVEEKMNEVKKEKEGFVDSETGKVYKTEGALKAAQTRRQKKAGKKKATKKAKKK